MTWLGLGLGLGVGACAPQDLLLGRVTDGETGDPIAGAVLAGEEGAIYFDNPDKTKGNPSYVFGAVTDAQGLFQLAVSSPMLVGLHAFVDGYRYGPLPVPVAGEVTAELQVGRQLASDVKPTATNLQVAKTDVAPGEEVAVSIDVRAGQYRDPATGSLVPDPLSEEVLLVQPDLAWSVAMTPPPPGGVPGAWPDGTWTATIRAPSRAGTFTYHLVATSENCINADSLTFTLNVR